MNVIEEIKKLNLPKDSYVVVGGAGLAVRGIRETQDLDIVIEPELFEKLSVQAEWSLDAEYEKKWNRKRLKKGVVEIYPDLYFEKTDTFMYVKDLIKNTDIIEGIHFQTIDHLMMCKQDTGREKDLRDIELIKKYKEKNR